VHPPTTHCRSTVLTPTGRADVCLPSDVPVAELVPMLMELLGTPATPDDRPVPWRLTGAGGGPLPPGATLDELGVLDGELLRLGPAAPPPPAPVFDDPVDALAALAAPAAEPDRTHGAVVVLLGLVPAATLLLGGVRTGSFLWTAVAVGGVFAAASIVHAARLGRDDLPAALLPALCAVPPATAAGWAAAPGPGAGSVLLAAVAAGVAAALGQVAVRTAAAPLIGVAAAAVPTAAAAAVHLRFGLPVHTIAAVTAAVALCVGPLLPRLVLWLAGLPRPVVPTDAATLTAADDGADLLAPAELAARSRLAHRELAGLSGGCAVIAAVAGPLAAGGGSPAWAGPALAAGVAVVLLLRARGFADPATARVHLVAGTGAAVALLAGVAVTLGPAGHLAGALVLLGGTAAVVLRLGRPGAASPVARRAVDAVEAALTAATLPLALVVSGVFELVRAR
jgi:type VII secretion integral membrane protein EccD